MDRDGCVLALHIRALLEVDVPDGAWHQQDEDNDEDTKIDLDRCATFELEDGPGGPRWVLLDGGRLPITELPARLARRVSRCVLPRGWDEADEVWPRELQGAGGRERKPKPTQRAEKPEKPERKVSARTLALADQPPAEALTAWLRRVLGGAGDLAAAAATFATLEPLDRRIVALRQLLPSADTLRTQAIAEALGITADELRRREWAIIERLRTGS